MRRAEKSDIKPDRKLSLREHWLDGRNEKIEELTYKHAFCDNFFIIKPE